MAVKGWFIDTNVWLQYFQERRDAHHLDAMLENGTAWLHPLVVGEILIGQGGSDSEVAMRSFLLSMAWREVGWRDVFRHMCAPYIERERLGRVKIVDATLVGSCLHAQGGLWTYDQRLRHVAAHARVALFEP